MECVGLLNSVRSVGQLKVNGLPLGLTVSLNGCEGKGSRRVCNQWLRRIHASSAVTCVERYCPVGVGEEKGRE
jgi:hypothetical protein